MISFSLLRVSSLLFLSLSLPFSFDISCATATATATPLRHVSAPRSRPGHVHVSRLVNSVHRLHSDHQSSSSSRLLSRLDQVESSLDDIIDEISNEFLSKTNSTS